MFEIQQADPLILNLIRQCGGADLYRLVDPDTHQVYDWKEHIFYPQRQLCFEIWKRNCICRNCISRAAIEKNSTIIKLETVDNHIFMVISIPVTLDGRRLTLEVARDVTSSLMASESQAGGSDVIPRLISELNDSLMRDDATRLFNKRYAEQELCRLTLAYRPEHPFVVAMFDIDRFKAINDTYGHLQGDDVIRSLASLLKDCADRQKGWACRMGGDEYLLVLHGVSYQEALPTLTALQDQISQMTFNTGASPFCVSVSMGAAEYAPELGDWRGLLNLADQRMYENKKRN